MTIPYGIIALGAMGSLLATLLAFAMKYVVDTYTRKTKAENWDFGYMSAYCEADTKNLPIFMNFLMSHVCKILILCTSTIYCLIVASLILSNTTNSFVYTFCIAILSLGIFSFMRAYSNYKLLGPAIASGLISVRKRKQRREFL